MVNSGTDTAAWITVADAAGMTGMSRSTLRGWYRTGRVTSRMDEGPHGPQRMVLLDEVLMRARPADQLARALADGRMTASDDGATVADTGFDADIVGAALDALEQALIRAEHRADRAEAALRLAIERAAHAEALLSVAVPR